MEIKSIGLKQSEVTRVINRLPIYFRASAKALYGTQIIKIFKAIVKMYEINLFQMTIIFQFLQFHEWNYSQQLIKKKAHALLPMIKFQEASHQRQLELKMIQLYLMLSCFKVKRHIDRQKQQRFSDLSCRYLRDFGAVFRKWSQQNFSKQIKLDLKKINKEYFNPQQRLADFNQLTQQILNIAPPYNTQKNNHFVQASPLLQTLKPTSRKACLHQLPELKKKTSNNLCDKLNISEMQLLLEQKNSFMQNSMVQSVRLKEKNRMLDKDYQFQFKIGQNFVQSQDQNQGSVQNILIEGLGNSTLELKDPCFTSLIVNQE